MMTYFRNKLIIELVGVTRSSLIINEATGNTTHANPIENIVNHLCDTMYV